MWVIQPRSVIFSTPRRQPCVTVVQLVKYTILASLYCFAFGGWHISFSSFLCYSCAMVYHRPTYSTRKRRALASTSWTTVWWLDLLEEEKNAWLIYTTARETMEGDGRRNNDRRNLMISNSLRPEKQWQEMAGDFKRWTDGERMAITYLDAYL